MRAFSRVAAVVGLMMAIGSDSAYAISSSIVISQVFAGGGDITSTLRNDYIELFNRGTSTVKLDGWFLRYAISNDSEWVKIPLSGNIPPGAYYLVQGAGGGGIRVDSFDTYYSVDIAPDGGKIALFSMDTDLSVNCPRGMDGLVDLVGYGNANCAESPRAPALDNRSILARTEGGCTDTDRNDKDFTVLSAPFPRNSSSARNPCGASSADAIKGFKIRGGGGASLQTRGGSAAITTGFARIQPSEGDATPAGIAIFGLETTKGVVTEASVPATPLIRSGLFYAAVYGSVNTGLAIVNPNNEDVPVNFTLIDSSGNVHQGEPVTIPANSQLARFLNEMPWGISPPLDGTFLFSSPAPIGVTVLRGFTNERGEFLVTTLPIINPLSVPSTDPAFIPHFAVNGGWKTEVILVNSSPNRVEGTLEFFDQSGRPATVPIGTSIGSSIRYSAIQQGAQRIVLSGNEPAVRVGSIRITPAGGNATPTALAIFSFRSGGITVSETGVAAVRGSAFRTYVELSGSQDAANPIASGFAIANTSATPASVRLELLRLDGTPTGLVTGIPLPGSGQVAEFLNEAFPSLSGPFQGILRMVTSGSISVVGLRGRYNQRGDFVLSTTPPNDEANPDVSVPSFFPHIVDSGGYTTQFVLLSGKPDQALSGTLRFAASGGRPLALDLK